MGALFYLLNYSYPFRIVDFIFFFKTDNNDLELTRNLELVKLLWVEYLAIAPVLQTCALQVSDSMRKSPKNWNCTFLKVSSFLLSSSQLEGWISFLPWWKTTFPLMELHLWISIFQPNNFNHTKWVIFMRIAM